MKKSAVFIVFVFLAIFSTAEAKTPRTKQAIAAFKKEQPCPVTGSRYGPCPGWQIDHVVPLKCDGPDEPSNMQWLTIEDHKRKTKREAKLCRLPRH